MENLKSRSEVGKKVIAVYGIDRKGLKLQGDVETGRLKLVFLAFGDVRHFHDYDGVIFFQGSFLSPISNAKEWSFVGRRPRFGQIAEQRVERGGGTGQKGKAFANERRRHGSSIARPQAHAALCVPQKG